MLPKTQLKWDPSVLLEVLEHQFGAVKSLDWLNSYLNPREFKMYIGQKYSKESYQSVFHKEAVWRSIVHSLFQYP